MSFFSSLAAELAVDEAAVVNAVKNVFAAEVATLPGAIEGAVVSGVEAEGEAVLTGDTKDTGHILAGAVKTGLATAENTAITAALDANKPAA